MNVALDGMPLGSQLTGVGHYTFELARSLALEAPADRFSLLSPLPLAPDVVEGIQNRSPANLSLVTLPRNLANRRWWSVGLPLYLRREKFDLFHGTNYEIPLVSKTPSVVTIHDLSLLLHPEAHEPRLVRRAKWRLPLMARSASVIVTPTEAVKAEVCDRLGIDKQKVVVTHEAPRAVFQRRPPEEALETRRRLNIADDFILFVGTLEPRKNVQRLVAAFELVLQRTVPQTRTPTTPPQPPNATPQLVIAGGRGWLMDDFAASLKQRGLSDKIRCPGYLDDDELCALYSSCKLFIYPSLYEGFGLPPLEAMACGAPVITSNIPSIKEVASNGARLVDPLNVGDVAAAIAHLLTNDEARKSLAEAGRKRVRSFTWERTAQQTLEVYRKLLQPQITRENRA
jgi:glycosyltransferase involved in cell wall biosynthesis